MLSLINKILARQDHHKQRKWNKMLKSVYINFKKTKKTVITKRYFVRKGARTDVGSKYRQFVTYVFDNMID